MIGRQLEESGSLGSKGGIQWLTVLFIVLGTAGVTALVVPERLHGLVESDVNEVRFA